MMVLLAFLCFGDLSKLCDEGRLKDVHEVVISTKQQVVDKHMDDFVHLLQRCMKERDLAAGRKVHFLIVKSGFECDVFLGSYLVRMFVFFERLTEAKQVFSKISKPNVYSWSAIISAHAKCGQIDQAIKLYHQMRKLTVEPDGHIFVAVLKACATSAALGQGKKIHRHVIESGFELDVYVGSTLVDMYTKCGNLEDAHAVFDRLPSRNVVTWSLLIKGYTECDHGWEALQIFQKMQVEKMDPDQIIFVCVLKACTSIAALQQGWHIHACILERGFESDIWIHNTLIDMYAKCGDLEAARIAFDRLPEQDVVACSALIAGYTQHDHGQQAIQVFEQMLQDCVEADLVTYICVLKACSSIAALEKGQQIHAFIIQSGFEANLFVGSTLIDMYAKCGSLKDAHIVFHRLPERNVVTWNALVSGYSEHECGEDAFQLFVQMQLEGIDPDPITFHYILKQCDSNVRLEQGKQIHGHIVQNGVEWDSFVGNALVDMYAKCGSLNDAHTVFEKLPKQDVVTWSALIGGYAEHEHSLKALQLYEFMQQVGPEPDPVTFLCVLKACSNIACLDQGKHIHGQIIERGWEADEFLGSNLIDMYSKSGSLEDACRVFDKLQTRTVVAWNVLIAGYTQHDHYQEALKLFQQMQMEGAVPNIVTLVCTLKACSSVAALEQGRHIHGHIIDSGFKPNVIVSSTLVHMYAKCGSLDEACIVFDTLPERNIVTWSTLIAGCAQDSDYSLAFRSFEGMQRAGFKPDDVAFLSLLSACSRAGFVEMGCMHFKSMRNDHCIAPKVEHYNSMLDLLGQAGWLNEAEDLLETIPFGTNIVGWTSLLSSCRKHTNVDLGKRCFDRFVTMDCGDAAGYVLMSSIYARAGMHEEAVKVEELRTRVNGWKKPAKAYIEIDHQVHGFVVGDKVHPRIDDIYAKLKTLNMKMMEEGYQPNLDSVLDSKSDKEKAEALCGHCEKLAIAFGLICTTSGTSIRVAKNLRMCGDCHIATEVISRIEMREIIVTDAYCIHRFQDGACSCNKDNY